MKKLLLIVLSVAMTLGMTMTALADSKNTKGSKAEYELSETYEWSVPADTVFTDVKTIQALGSDLSKSVSVTNCSLEEDKTLNISLDESNTFQLTAGSKTLDYEISKTGTTETWAPLAKGDKVLSISSGEGDSKSQALYGKITSDKPVVAGKYKDTITFVATVDTKINLKGYTWTAKDGLFLNPGEQGGNPDDYSLTGEYIIKFETDYCYPVTVNKLYFSSSEHSISFDGTDYEGTKTKELFARITYNESSQKWTADGYSPDQIKVWKFDSTDAGTDATNEQLIEWLNEHGTLAPPTE